MTLVTVMSVILRNSGRFRNTECTLPQLGHHPCYNSQCCQWNTADDKTVGGPLRSCRRFIFHSMCACRTQRANVDRYGRRALVNFHVRTSSSRTPRAHVKDDVRTSTISTFARRVLHAHVDMVDCAHME